MHRLFIATLLVVTSVAPQAVRAGGGPENVLLIIDPDNPDSVLVGNYYRHARRIPDRNVLFMEPASADFAAHVTTQLETLSSMLAHRGVADHIDYIVLAPTDRHMIAAPNLVSDACVPVRNFSIASAYTIAFMADEILGGASSTLANEYFSDSSTLEPFTAAQGWNGGQPGNNEDLSRHYFIGALLGYTGLRGNTPEELITMIDRSVAADGTHPAGTFYFMETSDAARSGPRDPLYPLVVDLIESAGGSAEHLLDILPEDRHDCMGVMTGAAAPAIDNTDFTIVAGAFCDHMTSFAAAFQTASQIKVSRWIAKGAVGSHGAVEEPCNYPEKFPTALMQDFYFGGLSLGEAVFRSLQFVPFQTLFYGDPLARPFADIPTVSATRVPSGTVSGSMTLSPEAVMPDSRTDVSRFDLFVDGQLIDSVGKRGDFQIETSSWPDGAHEVRVVAVDDSPVATQGHWIDTVHTNNHGRSILMTVDADRGTLADTFMFEVSASGVPVAEVRLMAGLRVIATTTSQSSTIPLLGADFGPGPVLVAAEVVFEDGLMARSNGLTITIDPAGARGVGADTPRAFGYRRRLATNQPMTLELPATGVSVGGLTTSFLIVQEPTQATLEGDGPIRLLRPFSDATGVDTIVFKAVNGDGESAPATITIQYERLATDVSGDMDVDLRDYQTLALCFGGTENQPTPDCPSGSLANINRQGGVDLEDVRLLVDAMIGPR